MTAQMAERLVYRGEEHMLFDNPLERAFGENRPRPEFESPHTANWRGYVGTWEVRDDLLYLTKLDASVGRRPFGLADLFPAAPPGGVFADWCDDLLRVPAGNQLQYVHMGYGSTYERDLLLGVRGGRLVYVETVENRRPPAADRPEPWDFTRAVVGRELTPRAADVYGPDDAAFLNAVLAAPGDATTKLVYADWLEERDDPRARLVRFEVGHDAPGPESERAAARAEILGGVKDWLWMKVMGFPLPADRWGGERLTW